MAGPSGPAFLFNFYPRSPCGERLKAYRRASLAHRISIHALLAESDLRATCGPAGGRTFLSTLSLRRATRSSCKGISYFIFLSTLSLRRATCFSVLNRLKVTISIHALLAESDINCGSDHIKRHKISIHALLAESDASLT